MRWYVVFCVALGSVACTDVADYQGSYRGTVVGADDPECPPGVTCSFIRRGFPQGTVLELRDFVPPPSDAPVGALTVDGYASPGGVLAFGATPLEAIAPLEHDQLSHYDFPGAGRVRNYIFASRLFTGSTEPDFEERDAVVFVSLLDDDTIEVRVIGGGTEHFGVWRLEPQ